eukprot:CAMPEP_0174716800 /NCGR_PEP_ID=MMETSP1094-20130205/24824_1 /TAXON_ID=156173 /ORGANISM="Chrysochromulina brevifilum, Strain UTEX LB 985" /LENGTH=109 /DNA_ID=CAMNT_0015916629 /DNA_START=25 /DNA_END=354 /DNA_ORIENTATION=+
MRCLALLCTLLAAHAAAWQALPLRLPSRQMSVRMCDDKSPEGPMVAAGDKGSEFKLPDNYLARSFKAANTDAPPPSAPNPEQEAAAMRTQIIGVSAMAAIGLSSYFGLI